MQGRPRLTEQQKADKQKNTFYPPVMCHHGKRKYRCPECGGIGLCEHGRQKDQCAICRTGTYFCIVTGKAKKNCRHCKAIKEVVKSIKKDDDKRRQQQQQHMSHSVTLEDLDYIHPMSRRSAFADELLGSRQYDSDLDFPFQSDEDDSAFVSAQGSAPGAAQGSAQEAFFLDDVPNPTVFSSYDDHENQGGTKRKKRFTRRLRRNHNTKKKNKMMKRKVTKRSRKNKHK